MRYFTEDSYIKDYLTKLHKILKNKTLYLGVLRKKNRLINYLLRSILSLNKFPPIRFFYINFIKNRRELNLKHCSQIIQHYLQHLKK